MSIVPTWSTTVDMPAFLRVDAQPSCATADPEVFFEGDSHHIAVARRICASCRYRAECRAWALEQTKDLAGVWGGTTQSQRERLKRCAAGRCEHPSCQPSTEERQ